MLAVDSVRLPAKQAAAPLQQHAQNMFVRSAAGATRQQPQQQKQQQQQQQQQTLAKSREERSGRQLLLKQPTLYDVCLLHMLVPHVDASAPPQGLFVNMKSRCVRVCVRVPSPTPLRPRPFAGVCRTQVFSPTRSSRGCRCCYP